MKTYLPLLVLSAIFLSIVVYFKTATIFTIEVYSSLLLDKNVTITKLSFSDENLECFIDNKNNKLNIQLIQVSPTYIEASYDGDINAFSTYQPLKGSTHADAKIYYDDELLIDANATLYKANIEFHLKEVKAKYEMLTTIKNLSLKEVQKENEKNINASGILDANIKFTTPSLLALNIKSKEINIQNKNIKNINLDLSLKDEKFNFLSSMNLPYLTDTTLAGNGTINENINADIDINFKKEHIRLADIKYIDSTLSLNTSIFDGAIKLSFKNNKLKYDALHVDIQKALKSFKQDEIAKGNVDFSGYVDFDDMDARLVLTSKKLSAFSNDVKNLNITASSYMDEIEYKISTNILKQDIAVNGLIKYKDGLDIKLYTNEFHSETYIQYKDDMFKLKAKHIDLAIVQRTFNVEKIASGNIDLSASGSLDNIDFKVSSDAIEIEKFKGIFTKEAALKITGNYDTKTIKFYPFIHNSNVKFYNGYSIYNLKSKSLNFTQDLLLKGRKHPLKFDIHTTLEAPYNSKGTITHRDDSLIVKSFKFSDSRIKSNFSLNILELSDYKVLIKKKLSGPLHVDAKYHNKKLIAMSDTFGGRLTLEADDDAVFVYMNSLELNKIDNILNLESLFDNGVITGNMSYHRKTKQASTYIIGSDIALNGIDIDKKLSTLEDALGLNVIAIGKSTYKSFQYSKEKSYIEKLQFNTSLVDGNISLNDVAISTKKFRIALNGNIQESGNINELDINIVDKNGCALITQGIGGTIKKPLLLKKTGAVVGLVSSMPSSILKTGGKLLSFATNVVDNAATFTLQKTHIRDKPITITTDIKDGTGLLLTDTSDMVLSNECKVVYNGKVKHPIQKK